MQAKFFPLKINLVVELLQIISFGITFLKYFLEPLKVRGSVSNFGFGSDHRFKRNVIENFMADNIVLE